MNKTGNSELLFEKFKRSILGADAKINIKIKGNYSETIGAGNLAGMLLGLSSLADSIREKMEKEGIEREAVEFLLESSLKFEVGAKERGDDLLIK